MNNTPKISVIMSVFNGEKFLRETIESVLNQTFVDFEFLIYDNASTDKTVDIIKSYNDSRIKLHVNEKNKGYVANLNDMLSISTCKYIIRQDADDVIYSNKLHDLYRFMELNPDIGVCGYAIKYIGNKRGKIFYETDSKSIATAMLFENRIVSLSIIRREILNNIKFNSEYVPVEDYNFWIDLFINGVKFGNLKKVLMNYRVHENNTTKILNDRYLIGLEKVFHKIWDFYFPNHNNFFFNLIKENEISNYTYKEMESLLIDFNMASLLKTNELFNRDVYISYLSKKWLKICLLNKEISNIQRLYLIKSPIFMNYFNIIKIGMDYIRRFL